MVQQNKPPSPLPLYLDKLYLYLTGMKVHGDDMIRPGDTQHVGHQLGRDGGAGLVLLILPGVRVARDHSSYLQYELRLRAMACTRFTRGVWKPFLKEGLP